MNDSPLDYLPDPKRMPHAAAGVVIHSITRRRIGLPSLPATELERRAREVLDRLIMDRIEGEIVEKLASEHHDLCRELLFGDELSEDEETRGAMADAMLRSAELLGTDSRIALARAFKIQELVSAMRLPETTRELAIQMSHLQASLIPRLPPELAARPFMGAHGRSSMSDLSFDPDDYLPVLMTFISFRQLVLSMHSVPEIPREQIEDLFEKFAAQSAIRENHPKTYWSMRCSLAANFGETETAKSALSQALAAPGAEADACPSCETSRLLTLQTLVGQLTEAERDLDRCGHEGAGCSGNLASARMGLASMLFKAGAHQRASRLFDRALADLKDTPDTSSFSPTRVWCEGFRGNPGRALAELASGCETLWSDQPTPNCRFHALLVAGTLARALRLARATSLPDWVDRLDEIDHDLADLAARFDARNGNSAHARRIADSPALAERMAAKLDTQPSLFSQKSR